ncbi:branched-chain amino acid ABC transporter permease [Domibacillus epiphyticus]|uniref:Branched-chain amino acid ABC transporter permease n=1 Tax=Domibacillus epiphyticus TaxID=1714355 RepID=A0A1V2A8U8_9BACI|nr:branched-chain amino acid ABC transporter permease [Domibacillus epiphyticus]OMP67282.1 branched-chain amino acid ABC transporter permease [Domibacillus epiphyticus]
MKGNHSIKFLFIFLLMALSPFFLSLFHLNLLIEILILGIFALSLNLLVGYTGLVSLGHAAFFGIGAYASGIVAKELSPNLIATLPVSLLVSILVSSIIGMFCMKVSGFYFLMLTLAFSQMIYSFIHQSTDLTGGTNGLSGIPSPQLGGVDFSNPVFLYYLILLIFAAVFTGLSVLVRSPFGQVLIGIRENETRMKSMGYNTTLYKYSSFIIAGALGGVAGSLYTNFNGFISPSDVYWTMSGSVLIMVIIGGAGTMAGPVLGAGLIVILETIVSSYTNMWMLIIGVIFILFVVFFPKGIVGIGNSLVNNLAKSKPLYNESKPEAVYKKDA